MRVAQRVEFSLSKGRVEKLILCLGYDDGALVSRTRGALATRVTQHLLRHCQPGQSDVHNPEVTRANARDRHGRPRLFYAAQERQRRRGNRHGRGEALRTPQTWDTSRVVDFMGVWCDRLLLGDDRRPSRCAVLEPHVPPMLWGESIARVAQSHRCLSRDDILVVKSDESLPFGVVRLRFEAPACTAAAAATTASAVQTSSASFLRGTTTVSEALKLFTAPQRPPSYLQLGIGADHGTQSLFTTEETHFADHLLLPLCTFTAALWTASPHKAADYVAALTARPETLTEATANHRLWRTMQHAMLSTRDTALLRAYFSDAALDARFSPAQTRYFAETLLRRLREEELQR
ncbi:hypothetical protein ABB37_07638 [Leptomonas pyrrhocoris]|uniref:Uncharacterized protein n=1 Tax=Leptomonas pyrrhocoris TaxID=157538 RepID=A0A0M9FVK5_LEPPY|nr:hypothetical protein ABB37_07638 [Leptomonas pyrrhocoris]KPA76837.1 hypothetical protein ABB37_07638 [Leptomonas pyrrhocoris]|eukprot:XP_015655276.1 hypothetical protein ABB37_07638 [Leptomonas pyrrhocoris]